MSNSYLVDFGVTEQEYDDVMREACDHFDTCRQMDEQQQEARQDAPTQANPKVVYREGSFVRIEENEIGFDIFTGAGFIGRKTTLAGARNYLREQQDGERAYCEAHDI